MEIKEKYGTEKNISSFFSAINEKCGTEEKKHFFCLFCTHCDQTNKSHKMQACATIETPFMGIACEFTIRMDEEKRTW